MKLQLVTYVCGNCRSRFRAPELLGGYGSVLLRSEGRGRETLVDFFDDGGVMAELTRLAKRLPLVSGLTDRRLGELAQYLFGKTVDPDDDGSRYGIGVPPRCPVCGSNRMDWWEATEPPEFVELEVPSVTHKRWQALSEKEKLDELEIAANDFLSS